MRAAMILAASALCAVVGLAAGQTGQTGTVPLVTVPPATATPPRKVCPNPCLLPRNSVMVTSCSAACGSGIKVEHVECWVDVGFLAFEYQPCFVEHYCSGTQCEETKTPECPGGVSPVEDWTCCSASCGGGTQTRKSKCFDSSGNYYYIYPSQPCNTEGCAEMTDACISGAKDTFPWGPCSVSCGAGEKSRVFRCTTEDTLIKRWVRETATCTGPICGPNEAA